MTLKTGVMMLKIQLCITEINYIFKYILNRKQLFSIVMMFRCIFDQIIAALLSIRHICFQSIEQILPTPTF